MKWMLAIIGLVVMGQNAMAQDRKIDQLEILYDQAYYAKVLRKSNKLLADPEFDYSGLPLYYKSLALFRLADDPRWFKRHKEAFTEAKASYAKFAEHSLYDDYVHAHYYEIAALKTYLEKTEGKYKELGFNEEAKGLADFNFEYFKSIKGKPDKHEKVDENPNANTVANTDVSTDREKIVVYAKSLVGIKYVWAGSTETGFDCSGFTSYVCKKYGLSIPRTASGQMTDSKKVKLANANKGDLVFFGSGSKITHVGLVVSKKGDALSMVHASTSKGVIVTNIETSTYWKPKLKGSGTYLD
ncbi:MAG: cell wall-associated NlpC family hydrolase [Arenicella sp.]|jgi:cell wall-associated NlpC family hydrolase